MAQEITFPSKEKFSFRSKLIDALLDIRLTLSIKKIKNDFIMKSELKSILDDTKKNLQNTEVSNAIDDVFAEYFKKENKIINQDQSLSIGQMESLIDEEAYKDSGGKEGRSFVKADGYHRSSAREISVDQDARAA